MTKEINKVIKKKVVVKYQNGKIVKGWVEDFRPDRESLTFYPLIEYSEEDRMEINFDSLKAVFFVKDFIGDKNYKKVRTFDVWVKITPSQRKLIVNFLDGEHLYGTSHSYGRYKIGFFVYPIDPKDNNDRIFVVHSAVESVRLMKIEI
jgi:small nuclear ribonucleoprotein (snRNP)-like protein